MAYGTKMDNLNFEFSRNFDRVISQIWEAATAK